MKNHENHKNQCYRKIENVTEEWHFGQLTPRVDILPKCPLKISDIKLWKCHEKWELGT